MKISLNWIKKYVNLDGVNVNELLNQFTLSVAEIEGVEQKGQNISGVVTAKILEVHEVPNSKKLHLLKVDNGKEVLDIVCGAPNVRPEMIVALAQIGANVGDFKIGKAKLAGLESFGMCCSGAELELTSDDNGLIEFPSNTPLGKDIKKLYEIEDTVFEVDNKSLTNRPDLWGHYGIAREISALTGRPLKPLETYDLEKYNNLPKLKVEVLSVSCLRYSGITAQNITKNQSPIDMQIKLHYAGQRSINLLTDLTNFVMLELGQPMHSFDKEKVSQIKVENLTENVSFKTLDGVERTLEKGTMVIGNETETVAIAGIMGGELSGISNSTTSVLLESANFDSTTIRKRATRLGLRSESSARYEKTLDPELTTKALSRYLYLLKEIDENVEVTSSLADEYKTKYPKLEIEITKEYIDNYIGQNLQEEQIIKILESLEFVVAKTAPQTYKVKVPTFRATKDISQKCDLVEEITRIYGYDNIVPQPTKQEIIPGSHVSEFDLEYRAKYLLSTRFGGNEVHSYVWYDHKTNSELGIEANSAIKLVNALQKENSNIRTTLIPAMLKVVQDNKNSHENIKAYEIGRVAEKLNDKNEIVETRMLSVVNYSKTKSEKELLTELNSILEFIITNEFNLTLEVSPKQTQVNYLNPVNNYNLFVNQKIVGEIALVHPQVKNKIQKNCAIAVAEINYDELMNIILTTQTQVKFQKLSKFPITEFDFSIVVDKNTHYYKVSQLAKEIKTNLQYSFSYVSTFEEPTNSVITIKVKVWSNEKTLTGPELDEFYNETVKTLTKTGYGIKSA